jgi:DNA-binding IclR family transcriptional regulator/nitroimidazol reductase NimA-like FMN-containing flavoprotein (pyridoxamine 5'-phosphate oxidase superfamily)
MSQMLSMNRSTLLAVLNTLRSAGFVVRDAEDHYRLGPGLVSLGNAAARATAPVDVFDEASAWLVDRLGETVGLFALAGDEVICAAATRGRYAIGALLEAGQHWPVLDCSAGTVLLAGLTGDQLARLVGAPKASGLAAELAGVRRTGYATSDDETEPGQVGIAAPICDPEGRLVAAIAVLGPAYRLTADRVSEAGAMVVEAARRASTALGCATYTPFGRAIPAEESWRGTRPTGLRGAELDAFLAEPWVASLACLKENGYPYTVPVWYEWRDGAVWLVPRSGAVWAGYLRVHPRVSMTISEPQPPFRRALVEGAAQEIAAQDAGTSPEMIERRLAERYLGQQAASYLASPPRRRDTVVRIEPEKITSWEGLVAHPRYRREPAA